MAALTNLPQATDLPLAVTSQTFVDIPYLQATDAKLQAIGREIVYTRNNGFGFAFCKADSSGAIAQGMAVAAKQSVGLTIVPATAANLAAGALYIGIAVETIAPGQFGHVAMDGLVSNQTIGVTPTSAGYVRANTSTGKCEFVAVPLATDLVVGKVASDGTIALLSAAPPNLSGVTPVGGGFFASQFVAAGLTTSGATPGNIYTYTMTPNSTIDLTITLLGKDTSALNKWRSDYYGMWSMGSLGATPTADVALTPSTARALVATGSPFGALTAAAALTVSLSANQIVFVVNSVAGVTTGDWNFSAYVQQVY